MRSIQNYLTSINKLYQTGDAREHSYRGDLQNLLNEIIDDNKIIVTNEPARIRSVGAPDYSISKKGVALGYIEAKDIGKPLESKDYKEQFDRYRSALPNLIITDYLNFWLYQNGELVEKMMIAKIENGVIVPKTENFSLFRDSILNFTTFVSQTIKRPSKLAELMAGKARLLQDVIEKAINSDEGTAADNALRNEMEVFRANLIHDITPESFADIYAQTIAYGMFAARLHDPTLETFSRQEAQYLIPKSNPFLRGLFNYISGPDCDDRIIWIIDSLAEIFLKTDVAKLLEGFDQKTGMDDPIIHFYETFLAEYNPSLRKSRGVWYTPEAVVNFIVRACDEVLKNDFNLVDGLLDDSKIKIKVDDCHAGYTKGGKTRQKNTEVHRVQILDPATGTGTFLAETIKHVKKEFWGGSWSSYVEENLVPRLNGFELLMASYAMAHLKLDLLLMETGYSPIDQKRFNIFLTNSLEEHHEYTGTLFSSYLANESREADRIKKETPVMVVMGNPPYSGESYNNNKYITTLLKDYKRESDGSKLKEKNSKWLNNDYVKFIRYGEMYIEKNGEGILSFITSNSYLDGPIFRGMRHHLLSTFDKVYIINLHGNSNIKETAPDGGKDENVFDITEGVAIMIAVKTKIKSKKLGEVYLCDIYGRRSSKYETLFQNTLSSLEFKKLECQSPNFYFFEQDKKTGASYDLGFSIKDLFIKDSVGIVTSRDNLVIDYDRSSLAKKIKLFFEEGKPYIENIMKVKENSSFKIDEVKEKAIFSEEYIQNIAYRPFDNRFIYYDQNFLERGRKAIAEHLMGKDNLGFITGRSNKSDTCDHFYISRHMSETKCGERTKQSNIFPLYLYPSKSSLESKRIPNLNPKILLEIQTALGLEFVPEKGEGRDTFAPIDLLDYIYAILYSPTYREKYKEFLKIDFSRIPYPTIETFWKLVDLGGRLRALHLLEDPSLDDRTISIKGEGSNKIDNELDKKDTIIDNGNVVLKINSEISIANIPLVAWGFQIGGYQPAHKWLKDRIGSELTRADYKHYNRIINALLKTDGIMQEIDKINVEGK